MENETPRQRLRDLVVGKVLTRLRLPDGHFKRGGVLAILVAVVAGLLAAPAACQTGGLSSWVERGASAVRFGADRFGSVGGVRLLPPVKSAHPGYFDVLVLDLDDLGVAGTVHLLSCPVKTPKDLRRIQQFGVRITAYRSEEDGVNERWNGRVARRCSTDRLPKSVRNQLVPLQKYAGSAVIAWLSTLEDGGMPRADVEALRDHVFGGRQGFETSTAWIRNNLASIVELMDLSPGEVLDLSAEMDASESPLAFSLLPVEAPPPPPPPAEPAVADCVLCEAELLQCREELNELTQALQGAAALLEVNR